MKRLISLLLIIAFAVSLSAYSELYSDEIVGELNSPLTAYSAGTGSVMFMSNPIVNPSLKRVSEGYYISGGFGGLQYRETQARYLFDSYDNNIGKTTTYDNSYFYGEPYYITAFIPVSSFGINLGFANLYSQDYDYEKTYRDNNYVTLYQEKISNTGSINAYFLSASYSIWHITVGGNLSIIQGDDEKTYSIMHVDPAMTDSTHNIDEEYSSIKGGFSIAFEPAERFNMTAFYHLPANIKNQRSIDAAGSDTVSTADRHDGYIPTIAGFGIMYRPANIRPVTLLLEAVYERWTELNGPSSYDYSDIIKYHLGIKHRMGSNIEMMYGILYEPYRRYANYNHAADAGITAGFNYTVNDVVFSLAGQYVQNTYNIDDQYNTNRMIKMNTDIGINF
ncbi:MAG: hypothetical protein SVK54_03905 [candidate division WOR-3 bacterium]|nr:hypothetical protein [candidate division WOR-3 bacterium]